MIQEHFFNKCFYFANRFSGEVKRHILRQKPSHKAPGSRPALTFWLFQIINARCNSTAEPMWRLEDKAGLARVTLALGKEKAELLALLSILLPLTLGWETPMAGSHLRCIKQHWSSSLHCAAGDAGWQLWEGVCHVSLPHQQTGQGVVTLLPHLWGSWLADCKWVLLLAEGESSPHPQSTGDFSQDGRSHRTIIPVSDYINNLPIGFALRSITFPYCLQSEGSLGLQEVITKSDKPGLCLAQLWSSSQAGCRVWNIAGCPSLTSLCQLCQAAASRHSLGSDGKSPFPARVLLSCVWAGNVKQRTSPAAD